MNPDSLPLLPLVLGDVPAALRRALDQEGVPCIELHAGRPQGRFVLYDSALAEKPLLAAGQTGIDVGPLRDEFRYDPFAALDDTRSQPHRWQVGNWAVREEVARFDKRSVRRQLLARLRSWLELRGGVWLCVAPYPYPYRSAFNFRFDHDSYIEHDFNAALYATAGFEECFTHFISGAGFAEHPAPLGKLRGHDVGSHGFWHHTYADATSNLRNIRRGIAVLEVAGLRPLGFAAPHGRYNQGLHDALVELEIPYSSEFALAYDELPFYVDSAGLLQVPIHPVCLGIVLEAAERRAPGNDAHQLAAVEAFTEHLRQFAQAQYALGEPVFVYGHPDGRLGRWPQVVRGVLETVDSFAAIWKTSLGEFARWWRARAEVQLRVYAQGEGYLVLAEHLPALYRVGIDYWRGEHVAPMPLAGSATRFAPGVLGFQRRRSDKEPVRPVRIDRPEGLRGRLRRWLDWERVTPLEEIDASHLRGRLKRGLRKLRGE